MNIHCKYDSLVESSSLRPHPKNRNKHPEDQIKRLAQILEYQGIRAPIVVSRLSDRIVKGHGTLQAIKANGWDKAPVVYQDFENSDQEWLFVQSDNAIANWAQLDLQGINADLSELGPFDIDLIGIKNFEVEPLDKLGNEENPYSTKIQAPIYEPKGEKPHLVEVVDTKKFSELVAEINESNVDEQFKTFLTLTAHRMIVFNYEKIAELYCHCTKEEQELMEKLALVIIDFNKAIENGFVTLTKDLTEAYQIHEQ